MVGRSISATSSSSPSSLSRCHGSDDVPSRSVNARHQRRPNAFRRPRAPPRNRSGVVPVAPEPEPPSDDVREHDQGHERPQRRLRGLVRVIFISSKRTIAPSKSNRLRARSRSSTSLRATSARSRISDWMRRNVASETRSPPVAAKYASSWRTALKRSSSATPSTDRSRARTRAVAIGSRGKSIKARSRRTDAAPLRFCSPSAPGSLGPQWLELRPNALAAELEATVGSFQPANPPTPCSCLRRSRHCRARQRSIAARHRIAAPRESSGPPGSVDSVDNRAAAAFPEFSISRMDPRTD